SGFVDHIVDFATKSVQRRDGLAALGRQKQKGVIEAGAAFGGLVLAVFVRTHACTSVRRVGVKALRAGPAHATEAGPNRFCPAWVVEGICRSVIGPGVQGYASPHARPA